MSLMYDKETIAEKIRLKLLAFDLRTVCENISEIYLKNENIPELLESRQGISKIQKYTKDYVNKRIDGITKDTQPIDLLRLKQNLGFEITKNNVTEATINKLEQDLKDSITNAILITFGDIHRCVILPSIALDRLIYVLGFISTNRDLHNEIHNRLKIKTYNEDRSLGTRIHKEMNNERFRDILNKTTARDIEMQKQCFNFCMHNLGLTKLDNKKVLEFLKICKYKLSDINSDSVKCGHVLYNRRFYSSYSEKLETESKAFSIYGMTLEEDTPYIKSIGVFLIDKSEHNLKDSRNMELLPSEWNFCADLAYFKITLLRTGELTYRDIIDESGLIYCDEYKYSFNRKLASLESISSFGSLENSAKACKQEIDKMIDSARKNRNLNENARWLNIKEIDNLMDNIIKKYTGYNDIKIVGFHKIEL